MTRWHVITPEYPPKIGGVADYTRLVAEGLAAAGDEVHVWYAKKVTETPPGSQGVRLHPTLTGLGPAALAETERHLDLFPRPRQLLVQWVPHGYGWHAMNLPFCWWLHRRASRGDLVHLMVHEPFLQFRGKPMSWVIAGVQRIMAGLVLAASSHVWLSTPRWEEYLRPYAPRKTRFEWLPIPSNMPCNPIGEPPDGGTAVVGHFSTFAPGTARPLASALQALLSQSADVRVKLIGKDSDAFREQLLSGLPNHSRRIEATGTLPADRVSEAIGGCAVMLQPIVDGVTVRNASVLACLRNGRPVVTTRGPLTEPFWERATCLRMVPEGKPDELARETLRVARDMAVRVELGTAGKELYERTFDLSATLQILRAAYAG